MGMTAGKLPGSVRTRYDWLGTYIHGRLQYTYLITATYKRPTAFGRQLSIGDGILLAALCRTQTGNAVTLSKAYRLREGKLRGRPIPSSALATKMTEFERL